MYSVTRCRSDFLNISVIKAKYQHALHLKQHFGAPMMAENLSWADISPLALKMGSSDIQQVG